MSELKEVNETDLPPPEDHAALPARPWRTEVPPFIPQSKYVSHEPSLKQGSDFLLWQMFKTPQQFTRFIDNDASTGIYASNAMEIAEKVILSQSGPPQFQQLVQYAFCLPQPSGHFFNQSFVDKINNEMSLEKFESSGISLCVKNLISGLDNNSTAYWESLRTDIDGLMHINSIPLHSICAERTAMAKQLLKIVDYISYIDMKYSCGKINNDEEITVAVGGTSIKNKWDNFMSVGGAIGSVFGGFLLKGIRRTVYGEITFDLPTEVFNDKLISPSTPSQPYNKDDVADIHYKQYFAPLFCAKEIEGSIGYPLYANGSNLLKNATLRTVLDTFREHKIDLVGSVIYESSTINLRNIQTILEDYAEDGCVMVILHRPDGFVTGALLGPAISIVKESPPGIFKCFGLDSYIFLAAEKNQCAIQKHLSPDGAQFSISTPPKQNHYFFIGNDVFISCDKMYHPMHNDPQLRQFDHLFLPGFEPWEQVKPAGVTILDFNKPSSPSPNFYIKNKFSIQHINDSLIPMYIDPSKIANDLLELPNVNTKEMLQQSMDLVRQEWSNVAGTVGSYFRNLELLYPFLDDTDEGGVFEYRSTRSDMFISTTNETISSVADESFRLAFVDLCKGNVGRLRDNLDAFLSEVHVPRVAIDSICKLATNDPNDGDFDTNEFRIILAENDYDQEAVAVILEELQNKLTEWGTMDNELLAFKDSLILSGINFLRCMKYHRYGLLKMPTQVHKPCDVSAEEFLLFTEHYFPTSFRPVE